MCVLVIVQVLKIWIEKKACPEWIKILPRNKGIGRQAPFILDEMKVSVTNSTVEHLKSYIVVGSCSAGILKTNMLKLGVKSP